MRAYHQFVFAVRLDRDYRPIRQSHNVSGGNEGHGPTIVRMVAAFERPHLFERAPHLRSSTPRRPSMKFWRAWVR